MFNKVVFKDPVLGLTESYTLNNQDYFFITTDLILKNWHCDIELYYNNKLLTTFKANERPKLTNTKQMKEFQTSDNIKYSINHFGLISQIDAEPFNYNDQYIDIYNTKAYKAASDKLNSIRLSLLIGQYGNVPNKLLDYGFGNGSFLAKAKNYITDCSGYDIAPNEPPLLCKKVDHLNDNYDIITFFDSLEHCKDLSFVKFLKTKAVFISVPYCKSPEAFENFNDFIDWFSNWKHRKPNEHLHHFSPESLESFFNIMGYKMTLICNMEDEVRTPEKPKDKNILSGFFWKK